MTDSPTIERIKQEVSGNEVMLFMKGTPVFPQCGFSAAVVQILNHMGVKFGSTDVLVDPEIRQGVKEFSNWPTVPQLYVKGEFVGGCDIIREMFEAGELEEFFNNAGIERETV
ncbi:MAG: Grx4 family monothiol glutaredoxin [Alphaproteobacteria bacterium]|nr:Grx4 family monothiol glutaredoxin [Alphaproteobacteria bacterium]